MERLTAHPHHAPCPDIAAVPAPLLVTVAVHSSRVGAGQTKPAHVPNRMLAALPGRDYQRLLAALEPVRLNFGQILYEPGDVIRHVYFPNDSLVSLLTLADGHLALEVGMVGYEGMVGTPIALGVKASPVRALVQGSGTALRMTASRFHSEFQRSPSLQRALYLYIHELIAQVTQTAACNRFHMVEARLARWLLMTSDRVLADQFKLTQEFLAHMLGVRRVGVTTAAGALQRQKLISYSRGNITILDRGGLEAVACKCYRVVKTTQDHAQGGNARSRSSAAGRDNLMVERQGNAKHGAGPVGGDNFPGDLVKQL